MTYFPWQNEYSVNIKQIDDQHKKLVSMVNELYDAMQKGQGREIIGKILSGILDYAKTHFTTEEQLMKIHAYADYAAHKKEHDDLTAKAVDFAKRYNQGNQNLALQVGTFLKEWLMNHIIGMDKKYSSFLNGKGVK
jgi:hemerythrin